MKRLIHNALAAGMLSLLGANVCLAENWAGWRGPAGMGITEDKNLPLKWDGKTGENVIWKSPLGGIGNSSPILWGGKVFVTISRKQTNKEQDAKEVPEHWVACFQASDGKELWRTAVAQGHYARGYGIYAVPTPVTDGERIYSWFSSGVFAALDFDGKVVWRDEVPDDSPKHIDGMVNSPILYKDTVIRISNVLQPDAKGTVQALDKKTGAVKWEKPLVKSGIANASPLLLKVGDVEELLIPSGNALDAINPADGSPIWTVKRRMGDLSPVFSNGILFTDSPGGPAMAIDPVGKGDITKTNVKWKVDKTPGSYAFASPVISGCSAQS
jgi:outer membrane protein assembly factor BamB